MVKSQQNRIELVTRPDAYHVLSDTVSGSAYNTSVHTTTIKCRFDGLWDRSAPTCVAVMCPNAPPSTPDNARREVLFQVLSPITISVFCGSKPETCLQTDHKTAYQSGFGEKAHRKNIVTRPGHHPAQPRKPEAVSDHHPDELSSEHLAAGHDRLQSQL